MTAKYEAALAKFRTASAAFRIAQNAYRGHKIGDAEFLEARRAFVAASQEMDAAEAAALTNRADNEWRPEDHRA